MKDTVARTIGIVPYWEALC